MLDSAQQSHTHAFYAAVDAQAARMRDADQFEFSTQLKAAKRVITEQRVADISRGIQLLTDQAIADQTFPRISNEAVLLEEVQKVLRDIAQDPTRYLRETGPSLEAL